MPADGRWDLTRCLKGWCTFSRASFWIHSEGQKKSRSTEEKMRIQIPYEAGTSLECLIPYSCWWWWEMAKQEQREIEEIWYCIRERIPLICAIRYVIKISGNSDPDECRLLQKEAITMWISQCRHVTHSAVTFILLHYTWTLHISGKLDCGLIVGFNDCDGVVFYAKAWRRTQKTNSFSTEACIPPDSVLFLKGDLDVVWNCLSLNYIRGVNSRHTKQVLVPRMGIG
jgi:hypothetical protein